jgi:hypothetical protein
MGSTLKCGLNYDYFCDTNYDYRNDEDDLQGRWGRDIIFYGIATIMLFIHGFINILSPMLRQRALINLLLFFSGLPKIKDNLLSHNSCPCR